MLHPMSTTIATLDLRPPAGVDPKEPLITRWGTSSTSPLLGAAGTDLVGLCGGAAAAGMLGVGRWAVTLGDVIGPPWLLDAARRDYLEWVNGRGLRPLFVAVDDPVPFADLGLHAVRIAEEPLIEASGFILSGSRRASVRHSVAAARRAGLRVVERGPELEAGIAKVSAAWLATKRGGELGFSLGRHGDDARDARWRVAVDSDGAVVGFVTWRSYDNGRGWVLDLMRRAPAAPNPTMDLLIADGIAELAADGCTRISLGAVPLPHGRLAERVYAATALRRYKDKFAPMWEDRFLVVPGRRHLPAAMNAVAHAYCPSGFYRAVRRNR
jgi:phosphatidylglycerol lysyltransferase